MMGALHIRGQWGLGDNIFARPFIRAAADRADVYLETPWPELYEDLPVRFVKGVRRLRTQMLNVSRQRASRWSLPPHNARVVTLSYGHRELVSVGIVAALERQLPLAGAPFRYDLPDMGPAPVTGDKPIALIRAVTVRSEWRNEARNGLPDYVSAVAADLMATHHVVVVADILAGQEWLEGKLPPNHEAFLKGEFPVRQLLALARDADVIVGGVGWIVPASIALKTKAFIVMGGHGAHNAPPVITDPRMDLSRIAFAMPTRLCPCSNMQHRCDKTIPDLMRQWEGFKRSHGLRSLSAAPSAA